MQGFNMRSAVQLLDSESAIYAAYSINLTILMLASLWLIWQLTHLPKPEP